MKTINEETLSSRGWSPLAQFFQKIFCQMWNAGLFENVDTDESVHRQLLEKFSSTILPKKIQEKRKHLDQLREKLYQTHCSTSLKTPDGIRLDGLFLDRSSSKVILFVPGIGSLYENIAKEDSVVSGLYECLKTAFPGHSLFTFNSRGIGRSEGAFDFADLKLDTMGAYHYLIEILGYAPQEILLYTHSLGGLHGIQGAALVQAQYPKAAFNAISDRSLGKLTDFVRAFLKKPPFAALAAQTLEKMGLDLSAKQAWQSLKGAKIILVSKYDGTIPFEEASFYKLIENDLSMEKVLFLEGDATESNHHTRPLSKEEIKATYSFLT